MQHRPPDEASEHSEELPSSELSAVESCLEDFMRAVETKDIKRMAEITKIVHDILHDYMDKDEKLEETNAPDAV